MQTTSYTDFRSRLKHYINSVIDDSERIIINRGKGKGVVLISLDEYNSLVKMEHIMSSPAMVQRIKDAEINIQEGKGKKIATEDLF